VNCHKFRSSTITKSLLLNCHKFRGSTITKSLLLNYTMSDVFCTIDTNRKKALLFNVPPVRYTPINPYETNPSLTQYQLDMRRKVEILQYNKNTVGSMTKRQTFTQAIKGATQRRNYSKSQIANFQSENNEVTSCPPTISTAAGVPGPAFYLSLDTSVPLYNYNITHTYATENKQDTVTKWLYSTATDIYSNSPSIFTLNIKPPIDQSLYFYTFTTSVGMQVEGSIASTRSQIGTFSTQLAADNVHVIAYYGGSPITFLSQPVVSFDSQFLTEVSGNLVSKNPNSFVGNIFLGNMTISNLVLPTSPGYTYDICINYIPSNTYDFIDNYSSRFITNVNTSFTNAVKKQESGLNFFTPVPSSSVTPFSLSGQ
jgi:hypothetical protein